MHLGMTNPPEVTSCNLITGDETIDESKELVIQKYIHKYYLDKDGSIASISDVQTYKNVVNRETFYVVKYAAFTYGGNDAFGHMILSEEDGQFMIQKNVYDI
jgi:hypothetical protein